MGDSYGIAIQVVDAMEWNMRNGGKMRLGAKKGVVKNGERKATEMPEMQAVSYQCAGGE